MCAKKMEKSQKDRLSVYKMIAQVILTFPLAFSPRAVHTPAQCLTFVQTDFILHSLCSQPNPTQNTLCALLVRTWTDFQHDYFLYLPAASA